jgi:hypothetical protein
MPDTIKMKMQRWPDCQQDTVIMMDTGVKDMGGDVRPCATSMRAMVV